MKTIKNKNKYFSFLKESISKLVVVFLVFSIFSSVSNVNQTYAYFSDSATISGNTFTAGTLNFNLNPSTDFISSALVKGGAASYSTTLFNDGSLGFQYTVGVVNLNTDVDLCNALTLQATNDAYTYNGSLSSFSAPARSYDTSAWNFVVTLPSGASDTLQDKTCNFKFTFNGWQEGLSSTEGFSDSNQINGTISSGHWVVTPTVPDIVLNEILPDPNTSAPAPANEEFIELYNNSNASIDLAGWQVSEISGPTEQKYTITTATSGSYRAVPYSGSTIISAKGWIVLLLGGNHLNNGGDTIRLYDKNNNKLDEFAYTTTKAKGSSYSRNPDGTGAWVDPIPTPGTTNVGNIIESEEEPIVPEETIVPEESPLSASLPEEIPPASSDEIITTEPPVEVITEEPTTEEVVADPVPEESVAEVNVVADPIEVVAPVEDVTTNQ